MSFQVMGILNVTPDSFSDGGKYGEPQTAIAHGRSMIDQGAQIIDVGGESTRPNAPAVDAATEQERVIPVIAALAAEPDPVQISVDTSKLAVAQAAVAAGASYVNDVTAFQVDPELASFVADEKVDCCLMHMLGTPRTMQEDPRYGDVVDEIKEFLSQRAQFALDAGIAGERITIDPGIGFGKTLDHNLEILRRLNEFAELGFRVLIGTSRKSFLGKLTNKDPAERVAATVASNVIAYQRGARTFRVHDVAANVDALRVAASVNLNV